MYKFKDIHLDDESMWPEEPRIILEESFTASETAESIQYGVRSIFFVNRKRHIR